MHLFNVSSEITCRESTVDYQYSQGKTNWGAMIENPIIRKRRLSIGFHWRMLTTSSFGLTTWTLLVILAFFIVQNIGSINALISAANNGLDEPSSPANDLSPCRYTQKFLDLNFTYVTLDLDNLGSFSRTRSLSDTTVLIHSWHGDVIVPKCDSVIGTVLRVFGEWEMLEIEFLLRHLKPGDVVIDAGANIGTFSLPISKKVAPLGFVLAFEMMRKTYQMLGANLLLNHARNVYPFNVALAESSRTVKIPFKEKLIREDTPMNVGGLSVADLENSAEEALASAGDEGSSGIDDNVDWLDVVSLDDIYSMDPKNNEGNVTVASMLKLPSYRCPRLIKTDAESFDAKIIQGAQKLIHRCRPLLFVENNLKETSKEFIDLLISLDYDVLWHITPIDREGQWFNAPYYHPWFSVNMMAYPKETPESERVNEDGGRMFAVEEGKYILDDYNALLTFGNKGGSSNQTVLQHRLYQF